MSPLHPPPFSLPLPSPLLLSSSPSSFSSAFSQCASDFPAVFLFVFLIFPMMLKARTTESSKNVQKGKEYMKTFEKYKSKQGKTY